MLPCARRCRSKAGSRGEANRRAGWQGGSSGRDGWGYVTCGTKGCGRLLAYHVAHSLPEVE